MGALGTSFLIGGDLAYCFWGVGILVSHFLQSSVDFWYSGFLVYHLDPLQFSLLWCLVQMKPSKEDSKDKANLFESQDMYGMPDMNLLC